MSPGCLESENVIEGTNTCKSSEVRLRRPDYETTNPVANTLPGLICNRMFGEVECVETFAKNLSSVSLSFPFLVVPHVPGAEGVEASVSDLSVFRHAASPLIKGTR